MILGCIGTDYQHSPLEILEKIYFNQESIGHLAEEIQKNQALFSAPIQEWVVLSTCNRVEVYFVSESPQKSAEWLLETIAKIRKIDLKRLKTVLSIRTGEEVVTHLFNVVAGIESMVFGENEILTQVKHAQSEAQAQNHSGPFLNKIFQVAIAAGKRVRKETHISRGSYSISSIAVECIRQTYPHFLQTKVLILGAGTMGLRAIKKLAALDHPHISISNRSEDKLQRLCEKYELKVVPFSNLTQVIPKFDSILVATSSDAYVLDLHHFENYTQEKPILVVDLSVPRNVNPQVGSIKNVQLVSMEGLKEVADNTLENRKNELDKIKTILNEEIHQLNKWVSYRKNLCLTSD